MAGHSKWSQIKRKKAIEDNKRGQAFTKLIKEIVVSARDGGGDPAGNARLRLLLEKAKEINMPQENSLRAIKRGTGELPGMSYDHIQYEGYGPHNVAIIIDALTDNKNRTVAELRRLFSSHGGALGETGTVAWMFNRKGVIRVKDLPLTEDQLIEALLDYDVEDISYDDNLIAVYCDIKALEPIKEKIIALGGKIESADPEWVAHTTHEVSESDSEKVYNFLSELQDHDDVQNVFTNLA